jgi:hypothetical protein
LKTTIEVYKNAEEFRRENSAGTPLHVSMVYLIEENAIVKNRFNEAGRIVPAKARRKSTKA